jgi:hypothetical protein
MKKQVIEQIQELIAQTVAVNPAGRRLALIGGFRYRLLDQSVRTSVDIDYHWGEDLAAKQQELISLFRRVVLVEVKRRWGYEGRVDAESGPDADSPSVRIIVFIFWKAGAPRIEIPIEITRIVCTDKPTVRTRKATIYSTPTDADMIESKVIALLNRTYLRHRDMADCYLFHDCLLKNSAERLARKVEQLNLSSDVIGKRMTDLKQNRDYHVKAIQEVIDTQFDQTAAAQLNDAGGAEIIYDVVMAMLERYFPTGDTSL